MERVHINITLLLKEQSYLLFIILVSFIKLIVPMVVISNVHIIYIEIVLSLNISTKEGEIDFLLEIRVINFFIEVS